MSVANMKQHSLITPISSKMMARLISSLKQPKPNVITVRNHKWIATMVIQIVNIEPDNPTQHEQMARALTAAFAENYPTSWATPEEAIAEVHDFLNLAH